MTYKDIISRVTEQVLEGRAWPDNAVSNKLEQQIQFVYGSALVVAKQLPLSYFSGNATSVDLSTSDTESIYTFAMPDDVFVVRPDFGFVTLSADDKVMDLDSPFLYADQHSFEAAAASPWAKGALGIYIDWDARTIRCTKSALALNYVPLFTKPTTSNYNSTEFPLPETFTEQVIQLVGAHVQAILTGNRSKSAVHNALSMVYGDSGIPMTAAGRQPNSDGGDSDE